MQTLIVTYSPWSSKQDIKELISSIGISEEKSIPSSQIESITDWHDKFFAKKTRTAGAQKVTRTWELAASQIFMANLDSDVWGWCDHRSTWLLDFWQSFDSNIHFVLCYTPAKTMLSRAINDVDQEFDIESVTQIWMSYHSEMLNFYRRHRDRCVFIDYASAIRNQKNFAGLVTERFGLKLDARDLDATNAKQPSAICELISSSYLETHEAALALEKEILAEISVLESDSKQPVTASTTRILSATIEEIREHTRVFMEQQDKIERLKRLEEHHKDELAAAKKKLAMTAGSDLQHYDGLHHTGNGMTSTELHFSGDAERSDTEKELELAKLRASLASLVKYSRSIQDEVERNYLRAQEQAVINAALSKKIECVTAHYPEAVFFDRIEQIESENLHWKIEGLETEKGTIEFLELELTSLDEKPKIVVHLSKELGHPFSNSFAALSSQKMSDGTVVIFPKAEVGDKDYLTLRALSADGLKTLDSALYLANRFLIKDPADVRSRTIEELRKILSGLPKTLRFHSVTIEGKPSLPAYESLQFTLQDTHYGDRHWKTFTFKIGATSSKGMLTHPRLEFHLFDAMNKPFENWFIESSDGLGERLELRFDTNKEIFDATVWKKLSAVDQLQLLSILSRIPVLLDLVPIFGDGSTPNLSNWKILALSMQKILIKHGLPANTFAIV